MSFTLSFEELYKEYSSNIYRIFPGYYNDVEIAAILCFLDNICFADVVNETRRHLFANVKYYIHLLRIKPYLFKTILAGAAKFVNQLLQLAFFPLFLKHFIVNKQNNIIWHKCFTRRAKVADLV